ncbi:MAG: head GIN domain-containing protein [Breznakibacter sp.]
MRWLWLTALGICGLNSCSADQQKVTGNGNVMSENRTVDVFNKIEAEGGFMVVYKKSSIPSIVVKADENLLPFIETIADGGTLTIKSRNGYLLQSSYKINVTVSSPSVSDLSLLGSGLLSADTLTGNLMDVSLNGSGRVAVRYAKGDKLMASLRGVGTLEFGGRVANAHLSVEGSGTVSAYSLTADQASVRITGSGTCYVWVDGLLNVRIDGNGRVLYKGAPVQVDKTIVGNGSVVSAN